MTAADWISRRRVLLEAATGPEWETYEYDSTSLGQKTVAVRTAKRSGGNTPVCSTGFSAWPESRPDAELIADARTSLPAALDALEAVLKLTDDWTKRGERLMASSETLPGDAGTPLLEAGADFVDKARRVRSVVTAALGIEVQP